MGEYAKFHGERIKIGTCEEMYYLREDQAHLVEAQSGNVDPFSPEDQQVIRFRFPWPDEDTEAPGAFEAAFDRSVHVPGAVPPKDFAHHSIQFASTHPTGYLLNLPCPESRDADWLRVVKPEGPVPATIHRDGFAGAFHICQQGWRGGVLALIGKCGGCGAKFNLPTWEAAEPVVVALRAEGDRREQRDGTGQGAFWHTIADRITAGYRVGVPA